MAAAIVAAWAGLVDLLAPRVVLAQPVTEEPAAADAPLQPRSPDPTYAGPLLYGFDPMLRVTRNPRLLGVDRLVMRERLLSQGVDPFRQAVTPSLMTSMRHVMERRMNVALFKENELVEANGFTGLYTRFRYPDWFYLFPSRRTLPGGFGYQPPRRVEAPEVEVFVDDLAAARLRNLEVYGRLAVEEKLDVTRGGAAGGDDGINFTIPIKLPRTLESIIGRGEKTNIRISGREHIAIRGETTRSNQFTATERVQSQSWFPDLQMEQQLQVKLDGQIGEKIFIEVEHDSEAIGPDATKIKLAFRGNEDDIIQGIETGDVGLTLPGGQLLGYNSNQSGLFGIKVTGQLGPAAFTVVASKQKAESESQSFNSSGGEQTDHEIASWNYLNNRFFRLDLPETVAFSSGPADHTVLGYDFPDTLGRDTANERIRRESIRVYRNMGGIAPGPTDLQYVAAAIDSSGRWDPAYLDAITADVNNWKHAWVWRPVDYTFLETVDGQLVAIDLGRTMLENDILAVYYEVENRVTGEVVYRVGDDPRLPAPVAAEGGLEISDQPYHRLKLLKPERNDYFTYQYVLRNIYSLGGTNINAETFEMSVETSALVDQPGQHDGTGYTYLNVFGLDVETEQGLEGADGLVDKHRTVLFDLTNGLLKFPLGVPEPFNAPEEFYRSNALTAYSEGEGFTWQWEDTRLQRDLTPEIYHWRTAPSDYDEYDTFKLVPSHAAASSNFNLGATNIEEGSETVTLDGRTLTRGTDYDIDYLFGQITLKGDAAARLTPDSNIQVNYQYAPFFGGGQSSLVGFNLAYDLAPESKLSTTWLFESNSIVGHKAKLGEEPSRTLVGNVNLSHTLESQLLTDLTSAVTIGQRDQESTLQFRGEAAISIPDPNTRNEAYLEDFEGAESSDLISVTRQGWYQASRPVHADVGVYGGGQDGDNRTFEREERVTDNRWFNLTGDNRVERRWLNPELEGQERTETQQALEIFLRAEEGGWRSENWGGVMRGVSATGLDLSKAQFVEIWINDFNQDLADRRGVLHIDFGVISEDFSWPLDGDGEPEYGTWQLEDLNQDGVFNQTTEDVGLDAWVQNREVVREGEFYEPGIEVDGQRPYPYINNTRGNNLEDTEDLDGNTRFDQQDGYYTVRVDLADTEALVDVPQQYPTEDLQGTAWRKYRIRLGDRDVVNSSANADLNAIRHVRIWYDDPDLDAPREARIQLAELSFLGSRWERQGIRKVGTEQLLSQIDAPPPESFFIGEINNKDNADYAPPFPVREENGIPEKETSLLLDVNTLRPDHMVRVTKQVSAQGDDYTRYNTMSWYWRAGASDAADLDVFFRLGADSLNYYEISTRMSEMADRLDWRHGEIELKLLTNIKNNEPDEDGVIHGEIADIKGDGVAYDVRIVGRPDLTRVKRYYLGVANHTRRAITGQMFFNDIILEGVKRDIGLAESIGVSLNLANALKIDFDWDKRDAEFHGLNQETGQGFVGENWGLSTSLKLEDYVPLLGFSMPMSFGRRMSSSRPKYEINSDIEILDEDRRNELSSVEDRNTYSLRLNHRQSRNPFGRYLIDPWNLSVSGSTTSRDSPTESSDAQTLQGSLSYNVSIQGDHQLGDIPVLGVVPLLGGVSYLPRRIEGSASFNSSYRRSIRRDTQGNSFPVTETETRPGTLNGRIEARPLTFLNATFENRSRRDLLRRHEVGGINIGQENEYQQSLRMNLVLPKATQLPTSRFYAPLRWLVRSSNKLRPSLEFDGSYTNQHDPGRLQPGDPPDLHSVGNSASYRFSGRFPLGDIVEDLLPERRRTRSEEQVLIAEQERLMQQARGAAEQQFDPAQIDGWEEMTPDQQREARQEWLLEQAERRVEEEQRLQGGDDDQDARPTGGGFHVMDVVDPAVNVLRNVEPVQFSYTTQRSSGYGRLTGRDAPLAYRFGFDMTPDFPDTSYDTLRREVTNDLTFSTSTRFTRDIKLDLSYVLRRRHSIANEQENWNYSQTWPDVSVNVVGIEDWGLFGGDPADRDAGWFKQSTVNLAYKHAKDVPNYTRTTNDPRRTTTISPSWNMTFHSDMSLNLNGSWAHETLSSSGVLTTDKRYRVGVQVKHKFRAQRLLARLGLYRAGNQPTVDMSVDLSYSRNTQLREAPGAVFATEPTGTSVISVQPRFSYSITRNLSGAFTMNFARNANLGTDLVTTTIGIGLEADFVF